MSCQHNGPERMNVQIPMPASPWRHMESAPRDGTLILIFVPDDDDGETHKIASFKHLPRPSGWVYRGGWLAEDVPQCWMPLPDPPLHD